MVSDNTSTFPFTATRNQNSPEGKISLRLDISRGISKLTIPSEKLKIISKTKKLKNIKLKAGSCIFFSYLTIHGSSSNASSKDQARIVVQMHSEKDFISNKNNLKFWKLRSLKETNILKNIIKSKKNRYKKTVN